MAAPLMHMPCTCTTCTTARFLLSNRLLSLTRSLAIRRRGKKNESTSTSTPDRGTRDTARTSDGGRIPHVDGALPLQASKSCLSRSSPELSPADVEGRDEVGTTAVQLVSLHIGRPRLIEILDDG